MRSFPASSIILLLICPLFASRAHAQTIAPRPGINEVLERAAEQTKVYVEAFKNLLADETKTFEMYDKNGAVKKTKTVRSSFIVYQFTKDQNQLNEYWDRRSNGYATDAPLTFAEVLAAVALWIFFILLAVIIIIIAVAVS